VERVVITVTNDKVGLFPSKILKFRNWEVINRNEGLELWAWTEIGKKTRARLGERIRTGTISRMECKTNRNERLK